MNKKICFKADGSKKTGEKIIKALESLGGRNKYRHCGAPTGFYYINDEGVIDFKLNYLIGYSLLDINIYETIRRQTLISPRDSISEHKLKSKSPKYLEFNFENPERELQSEVQPSCLNSKTGEVTEVVISIKAPGGYVINREKLAENIIELTRIQKKLPKTWEEGNEIDDSENKELQALRKLLVLRDIYNDGWKPDWEDENIEKYCIEFIGGEITESIYRESVRALCFKTKELGYEFVKNFKELIEEARPFL